MSDHMSDAVETSANRVCLPLGLYLPTIDEDPQQYLSENFPAGEIEPWRIVDYGAFAVALAAFEVAAGNRVSVMPSRNDLMDLRHEGYGPSSTQFRRFPGGISGFQQDMGFYPGGYRPDKPTLLKRYQYIADNLLDPVAEFGKEFAMRQVFEWGTSRDLNPHTIATYEIMEGDVNLIRNIFGHREAKIGRRIQKREVYELGARVLKENNSILSDEEFNSRYFDVLKIKPREATARHFGGRNRFWLEFGKITDTTGLTDQDLVNLGTRFVIRTGDRTLTRPDFRNYVANQDLPSISSLEKQLGGLPAYRELITQDLAIYDDLVSELEQAGIDPEITKLFCSRFDPSPEFRDWLIAGKETLVALSDNIDRASYVFKLMSAGLDMFNHEFYDMQLEDMVRVLKIVGVEDKDQIRFVLEAMPRLDPDEALATLRPSKRTKRD